MNTDRRQTPRFDMPSGIRVFDSAGANVGLVQRAGADGMQVQVDAAYSGRLQVGDTALLSVVGSDGREHRLRVEIRFYHDRMLGVRFAQGDSVFAGL